MPPRFTNRRKRRTAHVSPDPSAVTIDSDDDVNDADYVPSSMRRRSRSPPTSPTYHPSSPSYQPTSPSYRPISPSSDVVERAPRPSTIRMTTTSAEAHTQVHSFATYVNRIATENTAAQNRLAALEAQLQASKDEVRELETTVEMQRTQITNANRAVEVVREDLTAVRTQLDAALETANQAKAVFHDCVAYDTARCPLPLTNGKFMGFETVMRYWAKSPYFDGKATSMFQCPLTRQLIRVQEMPVVKLIYDIADKVGVNVTLPFFFQFDVNKASAATAPDYHPRWEIYNTEAQLSLFSALIALYNDRRFGGGRKTVQVNHTHTVTMQSEAYEAATHKHPVSFLLSIVRNGVSEDHTIQYAQRAGTQALLDEFDLKPLTVPEV